MDIGTPVPTPWWQRRGRIAAGLCTLLLGGAAIAYVSNVSSATPDPKGFPIQMHSLSGMNGKGAKMVQAGLRQAHAEYKAKLKGNKTTPLELATAGFTRDCYTFTGGTCSWWGCDSFRKANCEFYITGRKCICPEGQCSGADGVCYPQPGGRYQQIASAVKIKNAQYPARSMYAPRSEVLSQMRASDGADQFNYDDKFDIFLLPGTMNDQHSIFITSTEQPDFVAAGGEGGSLGNIEIQTWSIDRTWRDIQKYSTVFCKSGSKVQLGTFYKFLPTATGAGIAWWYVLPVGEWVWGWAWGAPDLSGQWTIDPPIDLSVISNC